MYSIVSVYTPHAVSVVYALAGGWRVTTKQEYWRKNTTQSPYVSFSGEVEYTYKIESIYSKQCSCSVRTSG